ncbi:gp53-like domain-containing protein [Chitinimonas sp. BJB300]|uniref:gp53-like domain-containing protein n=1 Tax=Chitinimonas sp. BJB300 TaxID=1559339 RepID=UPI0018EB0858|nr:shufflon system plasmid conjugative transfer pilus tip adhesin PilV [Chitinimonas sp. BJB300]
MDSNHLTEQATYTDTIYEIATTDPVEGGPNGVDNRPHRELANRTRYLKDKVDALASGDTPAGKATALATARTIKASGDATWAVSFDGKRDIAAPLTLAPSGVAAGTYRSVTADAKGRIVAGSNPTTLAGFGITDAVPASDVSATPAPNKLLRLNSAGVLPADITGNAATASSVERLRTARTIALQGDVSGSAAFDGSANAVLNVTVDPTKHGHSTLFAVDTRNAKDAPKDKPGYALGLAFKTRDAAGTPPLAACVAYAHVLSVAAWDSAGGSGGWPSEISVGDGLAVRQGVNANTWGPWRNVLTDANVGRYALPLSGGSLNGKLLAVRNNPAIANNSYSECNLELQTADGSPVMLGFHRMGYTAVTLYHDGNDALKVRTNSGKDGELLTSYNYGKYSLSLSGGTITGPVTFKGVSPYCDNWFRSTGATGWFNETYGGGLYMTDNECVRVYNGKHLWSAGHGFFGEGQAQGRIYLRYAGQSSDTFLYRDSSVLLAAYNSQTDYLFSIDPSRHWRMPSHLSVGGNLAVTGYASAATVSPAAEDQQLATTEWVKRHVRNLMRDQFTSSPNISGYQRLPSGMILQWGTITTTASPQTITFPIAFPNACASVVGSVDATATSGVEAFAHTNVTRFNFQIYAGAAWGGGIGGVVGSTCWIAIGY